MAGCSSDVMRFQDPGLASDYRSNQPVQAAQAYPGNYGAGVDTMSTGSVAPRRGGILQRVGVAPRPQGGVSADAATYGAAPAYPANPYPVAGTAGVSGGSALAPVTRASLDNPSTSLPPPSAPLQPALAPNANPPMMAASPANTARPDVAPGRAPMPSNVPAERMAVLPQQPGQQEKVQASTQPAKTPAASSPASGGYTVQAGDTLHAISRKTGASTEAIKQANGLSSGLIRIGQVLKIPAGSVATAPVQTAAAAPAAKPVTDPTTTAAVQPSGNTYTPPKQAEKAIQQASTEASAPAPNASGIGKLRWPVRGRVIAGFGGASGNKSNDGIDIAVPAGTPVKAAENGVVIYAGDGLKEFGNTVLVRHENGLVTVYGHASELKVQRGQKVRRGEDIALAGMSGSANTPKLHFEVRKDSSPVDPSSFLE